MNTNDLNPLESQMRAWTPRRPSPALEARLFTGRSRSRPTSATRHQRVPGWGWLAPVACAFVLALQLATPDGNDRTARGIKAAALAGDGSSNALLFAFAFVSNDLLDDFKFDDWGNRTVVADSHDWANSSMNNVNGETFKSTNWTTAPSSMRTLPVSLTLTNGLIQ